MSELTEQQRYDKAKVGLKADPETKFIMVGDEIVAKYKIEIHFGPDRTTKKEYNALITLWESGKHFHGGGDDLAYWCIDCRAINKMNIDAVWKYSQHLRTSAKIGDLKREGCGRIILSEHMLLGVARCPHCNMMVNSNYLTGHLGFHGSTGELALFIAGLFNDLGRNCDIYCKYHREDIRYKVMEQKKGSAEAHRLKGLFIYSLGKIFKDIGSGASLENRLKAFFSA